MNKYQLLGSAVLIYAFVTSGALLSIILGGPEAVNGVLWLVYVLAGFGLIRGSKWGRILTLIATSGSLIAMFVLPIFAKGAELAYMSTVWILFGLPATFLFVWALLVGIPGVFKEVEVPPTTEHPKKPRISRHTLHDIAYISFMILGLIAIWTSYWAYVDPDPGVIGFLVIIPFGIPLLLALILGPGISLFLWRDYRLVALTALTIGVVIALNILREEKWFALLIPYGAICTAMGIMWFTKSRKSFDELPTGYK